MTMTSTRVTICFEKLYECERSYVEIYRSLDMSPTAAAILVERDYRGGRAWSELGRPPIWFEVVSGELSPHEHHILLLWAPQAEIREFKL